MIVTATLKSTGQKVSAELKEIEYVRVHFIFYVNEEKSFKVAAFTRKREIERLGGKRVVFCEEFDDLWKINDIIKTKTLLCFKTQNIEWKTVEVCIYSHSAVDGPRGSIEASQNALSLETNDSNDAAQLTLQGWSSINFNFHPENSILVFYGCRTSNLIHKLVNFVKVKYIAGHGGFSGDSESHEFFKGNWFSFMGEDVYYISDSGEYEDNKMQLAPIVIVTKKGDDILVVNQFEIFTNVYIDETGNIKGKGKGGERTIKKENIKLWSQKQQKFVN